MIKFILTQFVLMKTVKTLFLVETTASSILGFLDCTIASLSLREIHLQLHRGIITL